MPASQAAPGGSMNTRAGQRHVVWRTADCSIVSSASTLAGAIGPTITTVMWLRSISAVEISAFSRPLARTSAW